MPSNFDRRTACPTTHSTSSHGTWTRGDDEALGVIITANGTRQYKLRCRTCDTTGAPVSTRLLTAWGFTPDAIEWSRTNTPAQYPPCSYVGCGTSPTEMHHFAPRNTFGTDADNWPVMALCVTHHRQWHTLMDGYRWHRKGIAA